MATFGDTWGHITLYRKMEDFILREIDKIGELLFHLARKLGLFKEDIPQYTVADVQSELIQVSLNIDLTPIVNQEYPIYYLVEHEKVTLKALEALTDIIVHSSDISEEKKKEILNDALTYLDSKGYISFRLHSL